MLAGIFAALAGYERELMHERAAAARQAARLRGRHTGRPARLTSAQAWQVRALRDGGESVSELVRSFAVSRATIYPALRTTELATLDDAGDAGTGAGAAAAPASGGAAVLS